MNNLVNADLIHFLKQCANAISVQIDDEIIQEGTTEFSLKLDKAIARDFTPTQLPVLTELDSIIESSYTFNFHEIATKLKWRPSPRTDYDAKVMALSTLNEMLDLNGLVAGLMFMTPNQIYPEHKHPPQEVYFVLSGTAWWLHGGRNDYQQQKPGDIIYNHPHDLHGMKTEDEPLLALYFLWGNRTKGYSY